MTFHQTAQPGKVIESGNSLLQSANRYTSDKREKTPKTCSCSSASSLKLKGNRSGTFINYLAFIYYCVSRVGHRNWFNKIDWSLGEYHTPKILLLLTILKVQNYILRFLNTPKCNYRYFSLPCHSVK